MSIPHGAINFAVTETTKIELAKLVHNSTLSQVPGNRCSLQFTDRLLTVVVLSIDNTASCIEPIIRFSLICIVHIHMLNCVNTTDGSYRSYYGWRLSKFHSSVTSDRAY